MLQSPPDTLRVSDGLLFPTCQPNKIEDCQGPAVVHVPADNALRQDLLHLVHDRNHFGAARTYATACRHFHWKGLRQHIKHFVA